MAARSRSNSPPSRCGARAPERRPVAAASALALASRPCATSSPAAPGSSGRTSSSTSWAPAHEVVGARRSLHREAREHRALARPDHAHRGEHHRSRGRARARSPARTTCCTRRRSPRCPARWPIPLRSHAVNATGTLNVLVAARDAKVKRVVYAASSSAYGDTAELPKHEGMVAAAALSVRRREAHRRGLLPRLPRVVRAAGDRAALLQCVRAAAGSRTPSTRRWSRSSSRRRSPARAPVIYGDGGQTRDFTYVENVVRANLAACTAPEPAFGEAFNIGCGERLSIAALWSEDRARSPATPVPARHEPARAGDVRDSLASLDRARVAARLGADRRARRRARAHGRRLPRVGGG